MCRVLCYPTALGYALFALYAPLLLLLFYSERLACSLEGINIGSEAALAMAGALKANSTLQILRCVQCKWLWYNGASMKRLYMDCWGWGECSAWLPPDASLFASLCLCLYFCV